MRKNCLRRFGSSGIGPHESKRARYYEGKVGEIDERGRGGFDSETHGVHVFQCRVSSLTFFLLALIPKDSSKSIPCLVLAQIAMGQESP